MKAVNPLAFAMRRWIHTGADHEAPQASRAVADSEKKEDTISVPRSSTIPSASFRGKCSTSRTSPTTEAAWHCPTATPWSEQGLQPADSVTAAADCHSAKEDWQCSALTQPLRCSSAAADRSSGESVCSDDSRTGGARSSACKARNSMEHTISEAGASNIHTLFRDASVLVGMHPDQVGLSSQTLLMQLGCVHRLSLASA